MIQDINPSPMEIMQMLMKFSEEMNQRFDEVFVHINQGFNEVNQRFEGVNHRFDNVDERLNYHQTCLERIERNMATKGQLNSLLTILEDKKIINPFEVTHIKQTDSV